MAETQEISWAEVWKRDKRGIVIALTAIISAALLFWVITAVMNANAAQERSDVYSCALGNFSPDDPRCQD